MKVKRSSVFETNSSSSHSITVINLDEGETNIPENKENYDICKEIDLPYNTVVVGEKEKLRYLLALFASYISSDSDFMTTVPEEIVWGSNKKTDEENWQFVKDGLINYSLIKWICEVIKEKRNTNIVFSCTCEDFPFFTECISIENYEYVEFFKAFKITEDDVTDEVKMKAVIEKFIFNPNVVVNDSEEEW